jgi:hypothetical protein
MTRDRKMFFAYLFKNNQMLKRVQHDNKGLGFVFCDPEPGPEPCPETSSGSIEFRI